jgi:hypothetical protein
MIPAATALIVKEHGTLPYPEGTACADVLVAGERGGALAGMVFGGVGIGALWKALSWIFNLFLKELDYSTPRTSQFPNATLNVDISPEYMGVGYVIGPRIAGTMFAGGVISWLILPLLTILARITCRPPIHPNYANNPATGMPFLISEMSAPQLWSAYIRHRPAPCSRPASSPSTDASDHRRVSARGLKDFGAGTGATAVSGPSATFRRWQAVGRWRWRSSCGWRGPTQGNLPASVLSSYSASCDRVLPHHGPDRHLVESHPG